MQTQELLEPAYDEVPPPPRTAKEDRRLGLRIIAFELVALALATAAWGWKVLIAVVLLHLILMPMVLFHEFGHYRMAKKFGIASKEFFIGFGPRLWSVQRGETEFGIKVFVILGGYVKIVGMSQYEDVEPKFKGRTFRDASRPKRFVVLVAGSVTHFITALVLLFCVFTFLGQPAKAPNTKVGAVEPSTPAAAVNLQPGDKIVSVDGQPISTWQQEYDALRARPGKTVTVTFVRNGRVLTVTPTLKTVSDSSGGHGQLGIQPSGGDWTFTPMSPLRAVPRSFAAFWGIIDQNAQALAKTFSGSNLRCIGNEMGGGSCQTEYRTNSPVGVASVASDALLHDPLTLVFLVIAINIFVGVFNLLPLLPLDGGHIFILCLEGIASTVKRRDVEIDQRYLVPVTVAVVAVLAMIFMSSLYLDILHPPTLPR